MALAKLQNKTKKIHCWIMKNPVHSDTSMQTTRLNALHCLLLDMPLILEEIHVILVTERAGGNVKYDITLVSMLRSTTYISLGALFNTVLMYDAFTILNQTISIDQILISPWQAVNNTVMYLSTPIY